MKEIEANIPAENKTEFVSLYDGIVERSKALGKKQGMEEGMKQGIEKARAQTIKNAFLNGIDIKLIAQIVECSSEEVEVKIRELNLVR